MIIGIDLGTTNSVIAIPGNADLPRKQELLDSGVLRPAGDAYVLVLDGATTVRSAVWIAADGTPVIGRLARQRAWTPDPEPAQYFKRAMGTANEITAGHAVLTAREASVHMLRGLRRAAEEKLGVVVDRAIVTVPAVFDMNAKQETTSAAQEAGLEAETLLEPVAAAMTCVAGWPGDRPRTLLVYDLGGGTCDVSVVSWDPEAGFDVLDFDGDRHLGGYEFDKAIASWIRERIGLRNGARSDDPADARVQARLLTLGEKIKHDLTDTSPVTVRESTFTDADGNLVDIDLTLTREDVERRIREHVERTLECCDVALEKAGISADDVDQVVLVGGSSRVPLVRELLGKRFGPRVVEAADLDLGVAVGAALKAGTAPSVSGCLWLDRVPERTTLTEVDVSGTVTPDAPAPPEQLTVVLEAEDGSVRRTATPSAAGGFVFDDVGLRADAESTFVVTVRHGDAEVARQRLRVRQDPSADLTSMHADGDILALDVAVRLAGGPHVVARSGTKLPYRTELVVETASRGTILPVRLSDGPAEIGEVVIRGLDEDLPIGSSVRIVLEFQRGWTIRAEATVPSRPGRDATALIELTPARQRGWAEMTEEYSALAAAWAERRDVLPPGVLIGPGRRFGRLLEEIATLLDEGQDRAKTAHKLQEAQSGLQAMTVLPDAMNPPLADFEDRLGELDDLVTALDRKDAAAAATYRASAQNIRSIGITAHENRSAPDWERANAMLDQRIRAAERELGLGSAGLPPAPLLQQMISEEIDKLVVTVEGAAARNGGDPDDLLRQAHAAKAFATGIDVAEPGAEQRLLGIYQRYVAPLREKVEAWGRSTGVIDIRLPGKSV